MSTFFLPGESGLKKVGEYWFETKSSDLIAQAIFVRHYSCRRKNLSSMRGNSARICPPGEHITLVTHDGDALFMWHRQRFRRDGQTGVYCGIFRNEGPILSSNLILDAMKIAWARWPNSRFYTFVDPAKVRSQNPGCCFKAAGWKYCGTTKKRKLDILAFEPKP